MRIAQRQTCILIKVNTAPITRSRNRITAAQHHRRIGRAQHAQRTLHQQLTIAQPLPRTLIITVRQEQYLDPGLDHQGHTRINRDITRQ